MAQSPYKPDQILSGVKAIAIPHLARANDDTFFVFPVSKLVSAVRTGVDALKSTVAREFCTHLIDVVSLGKPYNSFLYTSVQSVDKKMVDGIANDFGELLGALHLIRTERSIEEIIFPVRGNYELVDFFVRADNKLYGWSSKKVGVSNVIKFGEILRKVKPDNQFDAKEKTIIKIFQSLVDYSTKMGPIIVGNEITNRLPNSIVGKLTDKKPNIDDQPLSDKEKQEVIVVINTVLLPTIKKEKQNNYMIEDLTLLYEKDVNKFVNDNATAVTALVKKLLPELNVIKLSLSKAGCTFTAGNVTEIDYNLTCKSKNAYRRLGDKLGLML